MEIIQERPTIEFNDTFFREHITFTAVNELKQLLQPIQHLNIFHFGYHVKFKDGSHVKLNTIPQIMEYYYRKKMFLRSFFMRNRLKDGVTFNAWLNTYINYVVHPQFNVSPYTITTVKNYPNFCEYFHFGLHVHSSKSPEYLWNHLDTLYNFMDEFKDKGKSLIQTARKSRFQLPLPSFSEDDPNNKPPETGLFLPNLKHVTKSIKTKRLLLGPKFGNAYLTKQELKIIEYLTLGYTITQMTGLFGLSDKTMEIHMSNIKRKFGCKTLFELGLQLGKL